MTPTALTYLHQAPSPLPKTTLHGARTHPHTALLGTVYWGSECHPELSPGDRHGGLLPLQPKVLSPPCTSRTGRACDLLASTCPRSWWKWVWRGGMQWDGIAQSLHILPYSSPHLYLGFMVLKPLGSTATLVPQSAFPTQAVTTAKSWQVSIPWHGHGGQQMGQDPTSSTSASDLQDAPGQSSHRDSLSCQKSFQQRRKKEHRNRRHTPTSPGQGLV